MLRTYAFHIHGMHCKSCVMVTETELQAVEGVTKAKTSLQQNSVEVVGDFGEKTRAEVMRVLNEALAPHGYLLSEEAAVTRTKWSEFAIAVPVALIFVAFFLLLQKLGIVNLVNTANLGYGTAFAVGLIASVSTCMAVVGGLVLSLSASYAKEGDKVRPQALFHIGRLVSFFLFGGIIGALGSVFQFGATGAFVLGLIVAAVLFILGVNLLEVFPWAKRFQLVLPNRIGTSAYKIKGATHVLAPLLVGVGTFFLPCGFTQSMQIYTLTTGSFLKGASTMFVFALGTLPVLALLSFGALGIQKKAQSGIFFKTAGLIVIFFALFTLLNTLAGAGIIEPVFLF